MPLEFLKRGDRNQPGAPAQQPAVPVGLPEEVAAQEFHLKISYSGRCTEGVRLKSGPEALASLPGMLRGLARSEPEIVEPLPGEYVRAAPYIWKVAEATQWLNAHHELGPVTRHALVVLETLDALDLQFDTFACALLDGEVDVQGYPRYDAIVGGVASHWDEVTGDMIVRGVIGWGGRGSRGDTDRLVTTLLAGLLENILGSQHARGLDAAVRAGTVPAAVSGLICTQCGFVAEDDVAYFCPKCGTRLRRG